MPKRKLANFVGEAPVSYSGLSRIVESLRDGIPEHSSRQAMARAVQVDLGVETRRGKVIQELTLPLTNGGTLPWVAATQGRHYCSCAHRRRGSNKCFWNF